MAQAQPQAISHWSVGRGRGRGRGSRPQQTYTPSRRPGECSTPPKQPATDLRGIQSDLSKCSLDAQSRNDSKVPSNSSSTGTSSPSRSSSIANAPSARGLKSGVTKLKAKFSYKANPDSPLGEKELTMKQGQSVVFLETCKDNEIWWKVQTEDKTGQGFVPSSYLEVVSDKITQLPWLAAKQTAEEEELPKCKPEWKPYVSAYNRAGDVKPGNSSAPNKAQYYCKWCDKQLNGPQPWSAHRTSKAHKEEVDLAKEKGEYTED